MSLSNLAAGRSKRAIKKISLTEEFLDDYDAELDAIESQQVLSYPTTSKQVQLQPSEGRKRGRPRKYPPAPPVEVPQEKRPRGRPKGSGKHQKAAAAAAAGIFRADSAAGTDSGVTSCAVSAAPSTGQSGLPSHGHDLRPTAATPIVPRLMAELAKENGGNHTPHYPPQDTADDSEVEGALPPGLLPKEEPKEEDGADTHSLTFPPVGSAKLLVSDTPTPRPRNRRKCAAPTKTE